MPYKDKDTQREYQRKWMQERRAQYFKNERCDECGFTRNLELHHKDPKKKESHRIWSWSEKARLKELSKCVVLCKKCHKKKHEAKCGTTRKYTKGCRCAKCRAANALKARKYRARKKLREMV